MVKQKSHVRRADPMLYQIDFCKRFYQSLFLDVAQSHLELRIQLQRDYATIVRRLSYEGFGFVALTLSSLGKAIDTSFSAGVLVAPSSFKRYKNTALPHFLRGLLEKVYNSDGTLRHDADSVAVTDLRQICYLAYKVKLPHSKSRENDVIEAFKKAEDELFSDGDKISISSKRILVIAREIALRVFRKFDPRDIIPRHGPGAVATGEKFEQKWEFKRLYSRIHEVYPYYRYFFVNSRHLQDTVESYKQLERLETGTAKVVLVPKDARGPRLISEEPLEFQYIQQGLRIAMQSHLESHHLTKGRVNFADQNINRELAFTSSVSRDFATTDMKEASDRVSADLVRAIFGVLPEMERCLMAVRTDRTELPDGTVFPLKKYAPMGSAVCFPVESFVFFSLAVAAILEKHEISVRQALRSVYVYGDDLIIKTDYVETVMDALPRFGLKFNTQKSYTRGPFRESCGMDAFNGVDVTPSRWREPWPKKQTDGKALASFVDLSNRMFCSGFWHSSLFLQQELSRCFGFIPVAPRQKLRDCLSFLTTSNRALLPTKRRWSTDLQRTEYLLKTCESRKRRSTLDDWEAVLQSLLSGSVPSYTVATSVAVKRRWTAI